MCVCECVSVCSVCLSVCLFCGFMQLSYTHILYSLHIHMYSSCIIIHSNVLYYIIITAVHVS